jgi:hypothetical protein
MTSLLVEPLEAISLILQWSCCGCNHMQQPQVYSSTFGTYKHVMTLKIKNKHLNTTVVKLFYYHLPQRDTD